MTEFSEELRHALDEYTKAISQADPHAVLRAHSRQGTHSDSARRSALDASVMAVLLTCARDIHRPKPGACFGPVSEAWRTKKVRLAAVSMQRDDICPLQPPRDIDPRDFGMKMEKHARSALCFSILNNDAYDTKRLNLDEWNAERKRAVKTALDNEANFISLGEFDVPPKLVSDCYADDFLDWVKNTIETYDHPVLIIPGTRHEFHDGSKLPVCHNHAKIFANKAMDKFRDHSFQSRAYPLDHPKLVSAEKLGERLTPVQMSEPRYYETHFGRIGVLICVDAYSPNIIFSLINARDGISDTGPSQKLDFLLVPAYNNSAKLYYACQVLSMTCETVVLLADACKQSTRQPELCELFIAGRTFSDIVASSLEDGGENTLGKVILDQDSPRLKVWELDMDTLRTLHNGEFAQVPLLKEALPYRNSLQAKRP